MSTASVGIRSGNIIVNYVSTTKRTKQLALVKTTDITATTSDASLGTYTIALGSAIFYADSAGKWRMNFNVIVSCDSGTRDDFQLTFANVLFKVGDDAITGAAITSTSSLPMGATTGSSGVIYCNHASATTVKYSLHGDVELNAEPTTYTTAANMEGVVAADVWIENATTSAVGLVKQGVTVAAAAGATPTKAEFDALITSLKNAGIIASS